MNNFQIIVDKDKKEMYDLFKAYFESNEKYKAFYDDYKFLISPRVKGFWKKWITGAIAEAHVYGIGINVYCEEKDTEEVYEVFDEFLKYVEKFYKDQEKEKSLRISIEVKE